MAKKKYYKVLVLRENHGDAICLLITFSIKHKHIFLCCNFHKFFKLSPIQSKNQVVITKQFINDYDDDNNNNDDDDDDSNNNNNKNMVVTTGKQSENLRKSSLLIVCESLGCSLPRSCMKYWPLVPLFLQCF